MKNQRLRLRVLLIYRVIIRSRYDEYGNLEPFLVSQYEILTEASGMLMVLSLMIFQKCSELGP